MKVEQMINSRGNGAMNQFIITDGDRIVFQSYSSMIAEVNYQTKVIYIGTNWDYSTTTSKHRNIFFSDYVAMSELATKKGLQKALGEGKYKDWTVRRA